MASDCVKGMKLTIPFVLDDMQDTANKAYAAWPDRIYLVDVAGKVAYKGGLGPKGFKPDEARIKLQELVGKP